MAKELDVHVQSHICEQQPEVEYTLGLFPGYEHCAANFDSAGLLTEKVYYTMHMSCICYS